MTAELLCCVLCVVCRPDVLPPPVLQELSKLQDRIEPFSTTEARAMVEKELGAPIDTLFSEFSAKPIAAASLAQVGAVCEECHASGMHCWVLLPLCNVQSGASSRQGQTRQAKLSSATRMDMHCCCL